MTLGARGMSPERTAPHIMRALVITMFPPMGKGFEARGDYRRFSLFNDVAGHAEIIEDRLTGFLAED